MKEFIIICDEVEIGVFKTSLPLEEKHIKDIFTNGLNDVLIIEYVSKEEKERRKRKIFERVN